MIHCKYTRIQQYFGYYHCFDLACSRFDLQHYLLRSLYHLRGIAQKSLQDPPPASNPEELSPLTLDRPVRYYQLEHLTHRGKFETINKLEKKIIAKQLSSW